MVDVVRKDINAAIEKLENAGISPNQNKLDTKGLGDLVESTLSSMGITPDRVKTWLGLKECGCTKRKQWLNNVLSWYVDEYPKGSG